MSRYLPKSYYVNVGLSYTVYHIVISETNILHALGGKMTVYNCTDVRLDNMAMQSLSFSASFFLLNEQRLQQKVAFIHANNVYEEQGDYLCI